MKIRAILFDLDGTLIDQFEPIYRAFSRTLCEMGFPRPSFEKVKRSVGGASEATMAKLIGPERAAEAVDILRPIFEEEMLNGLKPLPGVMEGLKQLNNEGIQCAVLTNKYGPHARTACAHLGMSKYLNFTIGANDTEWKKPNPKLTAIALDRLGFSNLETIYIGDSPYDFQTAKNAELSCNLLCTGTHSFDELSVLQSDRIHSTFVDLLEWLKNHI